MNWTAVPKASIDKNGEPCSGEYEVRVSKNTAVPPPSRHTVVTKYSDESKFGCGVASRLDPRHDFGPLLP
jgi:hypothetical protein